MVDRITRIIVVNSTKVMPSDIVIKLYESNFDVMVKETCFGIMVTGERPVVDKITEEVRKMDPYGIFVKERGLIPGETYRCRANRRGGAKPGFHNFELEDRLLPYIAQALKDIDKGEVSIKNKRKKKLELDKLKKIITELEAPT